MLEKVDTNLSAFYGSLFSEGALWDSGIKLGAQMYLKAKIYGEISPLMLKNLTVVFGRDRWPSNRKSKRL